MRTIRNEAELTKVVNGLIEEGNPGQLKELLQVMQKRSPWKYKEQSIHKLIDKYRRTVSRDIRTV